MEGALRPQTPIQAPKMEQPPEEEHFEEEGVYVEGRFYSKRVNRKLFEVIEFIKNNPESLKYTTRMLSEATGVNRQTCSIALKAVNSVN